ncbi:hypothetical protein QAD02_009769 [Eretmocerus hayati]|uniref:Uncharacterized protein n=1 Tax=Eretmocerus hayati TaxID=131215 RepID=A0ACC2NAL9_9HYME|nr:hypothetical protein QAD02_009769 [Eretmocerus hayati]
MAESQPIVGVDSADEQNHQQSSDETVSIGSRASGSSKGDAEGNNNQQRLTLTTTPGTPYRRLSEPGLGSARDRLPIFSNGTLLALPAPPIESDDGVDDEGEDIGRLRVPEMIRSAKSCSPRPPSRAVSRASIYPSAKSTIAREAFGKSFFVGIV